MYILLNSVNSLKNSLAETDKQVTSIQADLITINTLLATL